MGECPCGICREACDYHRRSVAYGELTPARLELFEVAMRDCSPEQLRALADLFAEHGLHSQAALLRRRRRDLLETA